MDTKNMQLRLRFGVRKTLLQSRGKKLADVVVSYKSEERAIVAYLVLLLQAAGFSVWWDKDLEAGSSYDVAIVREIAVAKCVLTVWTQASAKSDWVRGEAVMAIAQNKYVPIRLDRVELPPPFSMKHTLDLTTWRGQPLHQEWWDVIGAVRGKVDPSRGTAISSKDYERRAISRLGFYINKLKARDATGRPGYYFVLVPPHLEARFNHDIAGAGNIDMNDYGMVIASNFGDAPNAVTKDFLKEVYGFDL